MKKSLSIIVALTMSTIMFTSCDPQEVFDYGDEDWYSNAWIYNNTSDTLAVEFPTGSPTVTTQLKLVYPSDTILYSHSKLYEDSKGRPYASYWEIMRDNFGNMHPVRIFLKDNDSVLMQFNPPCRDMGDTNSIFNSHSWSSVRTGKDNKYVRSTFTITEADYGNEGF